MSYSTRYTTKTDQDEIPLTLVKQKKKICSIVLSQSYACHLSNTFIFFSSSSFPYLKYIYIGRRKAFITW